MPPGASYIPPVDPENPFPDDADPTRIDPADGDTRTYGDPHLITFDRTGYSFQAVGEFTLVLGAAFEIQVRMEAVTDTASANTAVAMRAGEDVVAVCAREAIPLVVNGTAVVLAQEESLAMGDLTLHRTGRGDPDDLADAEYIVTDASGNGYYVRVFDGAANISPFVSDDAPVAGLLGDLDGDRGNDFALRDGTVLDLPLPQTVLYGAYADSWRITQGDSLFLYRDGESTETFTDRGFPPTIVRIEDFDPADVATACATVEAAGLVPGTFEFETTVFDLLVTGNEAFAEALADAPELGDPDEPDEPVVEVDVNEAPVLVEVTDAAVGPDGSALLDVLAGATDREDDPITLLGGTDPNGGVVSVEDGRLRFVPADGFSGEAVVSFDVGDGEGGNVVTGTVRFEGPDDPDGVLARDDAFEVGEDDGAAELGDLLANDTGPDGAVLTVQQATLVDGDALLALSLNEPNDLLGEGVLTVRADGTIVFDPAGGFERLGFNLQPEPTRGEVVVSYVVTDGTSTATAEAVIGVRGANDAPVTADDGGAGFTVGAGGMLITASVLANDTDVDAGDALAVTGLDLAGTLGTVTDNGGGTFGYDPAGAFDDLSPGESATDTFVYEVSDDQGATDIATVTITVEGGDGGPRRVTLGAPSEEVDYEGGILVLEGFDVDEGGGEARADTVRFDFAGTAYALSTDQDIVDFTLLIETDGDGLTDALVFEDDLVFVLGREGEDDGVARAIVLAGVVGRDGLTRERLEGARIDRAFQFPDEDDAIAGVVEAGDVPLT